MATNRTVREVSNSPPGIILRIQFLYILDNCVSLDALLYLSRNISNHDFEVRSIDIQ